MVIGIDPLSHPILKQALGSSKDAPAAWSQIIAGAVQIRHETGATAETMWFNPLFDAGLVVQWRREGEAWTITRAWPLLGSDLHLEGMARQSLLLIGPINHSVVNAHFMAAAKELPRLAAPQWKAPTVSPNAAAQVTARVEAANGAIAAMRSAPGYEQAIIAAYSLLGSHGQTMLDLRPSLQRAIAAIPPDAKLTLRAVSAFRVDDNWTVILQSPDAPGVTWMATFERPADAAARIASISMFRYAQMETPR